MPYLLFVLLFTSFIGTNTQIYKGTDLPKIKYNPNGELYTYSNYEVSLIKDLNCDWTKVSITNLKTKKPLNLPSQLKCISFEGIIDGIAIFDYGTSIIRDKYIYDLNKDKLIDTLEIISLTGEKIIDNKFYYTRILTEAEIKNKKLPECVNTQVDFSGYIEEMYYDFHNKIKRHTGKIKCIK